jgi:transcription antitermination factor NusG
VLAGPFQGFSGNVLQHDAEQTTVRIRIFGRETSVAFDAANLVPDDPGSSNHSL